MGLYVSKIIGRDDSARWCSADGACRLYAFHSQKAKRQMGPGPRCEHAVPRLQLRSMTANKAITRTPLFIGYSLTDPDFLSIRCCKVPSWANSNGCHM